MPRLPDFFRKPWLKRTVLGIAAFMLLFGLFAYFVLPGIVKTQAEKIASEKLHRKLSIERIEISPYTMVVDIHGIKLLEKDGKSIFVSLDHLHLDLTLQSLLRLAPVIEEIRLDKPYVHLARTAANQYNFDDLLVADPKQPAPKKTARFALYNIQVEGGRIEFDDQPLHAKHIVSNMALGVPFVSSLPSQVDVFVEPSFKADINGTLLQLKGRARPFASARDATLDINLDDVDLTRYLEYLPFKPQFKLPSAKLDLHLSATFRQPKAQSTDQTTERAPQLLLKGTTVLKSLSVNGGDGQPLVKLPRLAVTLDNLDVLSSKFAVARIELDDPEVAIVKRADGTLNLAQLAPPPTPKPTQLEARKKAAEKTETKNTQDGNLQLSLGALAIRGAQVSYSDGQAQPALKASVKKLDLDVGKVDVDVQKQLIDIASVSSSSADFSVIHEKITSDSKPSIPVSKPGQVPEKSSPGYAINIGNIAVEKWSARLEDRNLPQPAITDISAIALGMQNISNLTSKTGKIDIKAQVNQKGRLAVGGTVGLTPLHADLALNLDAVDAMPLQPYFTNRVNLLLTRAAISTKASLKIDAASDIKSDGKSDSPLKGSFVGDASVTDLGTVDKLSGNDFLRWKSLALNGINVQLQPLSVNIGQISLVDFFARVIIDPTGRINLQDIARNDDNAEKSLTEAASNTTAVTPAVTPVVTASPRPPIKIRKVVMKNGKVRFSDNFVKPNYTANLVDMNGAVSNLSSDTTSVAAVDLHGNVNSAPLNIMGKINPLSGNLFLDLKADVKGMELAPLSTYSGKYVGYGIEKGKLSFDLAYHLENRKLEAQNRLVLDQLTFGDKIDSPTATTLPVQLAVALLRDSNGVIDINLPIGGSVDDPQFSLGGIIIRVIGNLITKAVTAPFALLGSLFGGGEELSWLEFDPGQRAVPPAGEAKLTSLAKALNDRPALKLDITGRFDPQADREGLRRTGIDRKVRALKLKQLVAKGESVDTNTLTVSADEYPALLQKVYKEEDFSKPRNLIGLQKDLPDAEMEKLMMANMKVGDDDLITLGNQRAQAAKDWLVTQGKVPAERISVVAAKSGESGDKAKASRTDFSLR